KKSNRQIFECYFAASIEDCAKMDREYMAKINWYGQKENCNVVYVPVARTGPAHDPEFTFVVKIDGEEYGRGTGKTIKEAKAVAAKETWEMIDKQVNLTTAQTTSTTSSPALDKDYVSLLNIYSQKTGFIVDYPNKNRTGDPHVPTFLELFEKIQHIGAGGFGNVFKATSKCDKTTYAIKRVEYTKKVEREARGLARLSHENIVRYHCSWRGYDRPTRPDGAKDNEILCLFIQMEFCEQGTLEDWVIKNSEDRKYHEMAQNKFLQIAKGVQCIHSEELIHRDLKPQNIFISHDNKIKIGDFGLVTSVAFETLTENRGTRSYMAPEQIGTKYGREVDIYALGLIWFEILSAITAHEKSKVWSSAREGELPEYFKIQFPAEASIIKKMLSRDPSGRITISHLLDLLNSVDKEKALRNYSY
uniref:Eukaryotic translation initiation factor 2 alpha kinase 2 n=1 Tax=Junco hyemalis TaxID=40217 RepID=A0A8C5IG97_JUNHY